MGRTFLMFLLAVIMAVAAAVFANKWLEQQRAEVEQSVIEVRKTVPVVVAVREIPFGVTVDETYVQIEQLPEQTVPEQVYKDIEEVKGKIAKQTIYTGEILRQERVVERSLVGGSPLAAILPQNMRAVTVRVNDVIGVAGFLLPGDYVDVLLTKQAGGGSKTRTVLERLKILAVDQTASPQKDKPVIVRAVTLEVSPEQAEELVNTTHEGPVQLVLRNPTDDVPVIKPEQPPPPQPVVAEAPKVIEKIVEKIIYRTPSKPPANEVTVIRGDGAGVSIGTSTVKE